MSDISANRTDLVGDPSRGAGQLPADAQGQQAARDAQASALPARPAHSSNIQGPSTRPDEPVQAGLPMGPGPGPSGAAAIGERDQALIRLRVAAARSSSPALHRLLRRLGG